MEIEYNKNLVLSFHNEEVKTFQLLMRCLRDDIKPKIVNGVSEATYYSYGEELEEIKLLASKIMKEITK